MKRKIIIISLFSLLILITVICFIISAISSYNNDIMNNIDIFEGFGALLTLIIGGFVVLYEIDLFYTVYYFLIKPKTLVKTILNILSNLSFAFFFVVACFWDLIISAWLLESLLLGIFAAYIVLRIIYFFVANWNHSYED